MPKSVTLDYVHRPSTTQRAEYTPTTLILTSIVHFDSTRVTYFSTWGGGALQTVLLAISNKNKGIPLMVFVWINLALKRRNVVRSSQPSHSRYLKQDLMFSPWLQQCGSEHHQPLQE